MPKRLANADSRRFFDEFEGVKISRFRAMGVVDPAKNHALIPFPSGKTKLIGTKHTWFRKGGGWSYFVCPKCARRTPKLWLIDDAPQCVKCCDAMNIRYRSACGFGRDERRRVHDQHLDELIAKLETRERLRFKPAPASWRGRAQLVYNSRRLTDAVRQRMVTLRLKQLADQQASDRAKDDDVLANYQPNQATRQLIDLKPIWRANTDETLQQALDSAQVIILAALNSDDPQQQLSAAKLLMRTKQARDRGW